MKQTAEFLQVSQYIFLNIHQSITDHLLEYYRNQHSFCLPKDILGTRFYKDYKVRNSYIPNNDIFGALHNGR